MGLIYDFMPYTGKIEPVNKPSVPDLKPSSNSVLQLAESIPGMKNHKLYFDNWFTSVPLIRHLATRGIWCAGTVQANRLTDLTFKSDKMLAAEGRGAYDEWVNTVDEISVTVLKWYDNKPVCFASSFAASQPVDTCS
ncbi:unnamed protein product, partial [Meganyctiphanes norvegica]